MFRRPREAEAAEMVGNTRALLAMAGRETTPEALAAVILSAPRSVAEGEDPDVVGMCCRCLVEAEAAADGPEYRRFECLAAYFLGEVPRLRETRAAVVCVLRALAG